MLTYSISNNTILKDFLSLSYWQSAVAVVVFYAIMIPFFIIVTKYKLKFMFRVLIGLAIGLAFGVVLQSIIQFPSELTFKDTNGDSKYFERYEWLEQFNIWAQLMKQIFINGILLLTVPVVFVAIFRVFSKTGNKGLGRITGKAIFILLAGVAFAFVVTFWIGYFLNVGSGMDLDNKTQGADGNDAHQSKSIPQLVWGYVSQNFIAALAGTSIIPVIVVAAIIGKSVRFVERKHPDQIAKMKIGFDRAWDIMMSMLMTFMKIMPMAVMAMITTAVTSRPIGALATIGKVIGVGYLGILAVLVYMTIVLMLSGVNILAWWKNAWGPLLQGFATQSSNATLPKSMDTMKNDMKINDGVVSVVGPLSTSMGLIACAGVQSGLITSFLWTGSEDIQNTFSGGLPVFFIMGLVICLIASLGIAGIPGTATVVTSGVLGGLGFSQMFTPVYAIIGALDGIFDMGRTGANVLGGIFASTLTGKWEGLIDDESPLFGEKTITRFAIKRQVFEIKDQIKNVKISTFNQILKYKSTSKKDFKVDNADVDKDVVANNRVKFIEVYNNTITKMKSDGNNKVKDLTKKLIEVKSKDQKVLTESIK